MYILGIDTATRVAGVAVLNEERLIVEKFLNNQKTHSQNLLPMIAQAVLEAGITPADLGGIAVTMGPGSFTGLRIGMAAAKSLAQVLNIPIKGISTLETLAFNVLGVPGLICPILDAQRNQVYAAIYYTGEDQLVKMEGPYALSIDSLVDNLQKHHREVTFLGDAVAVYGAELLAKMETNAHLASKINCLPRAAAVAELGFKAIARGDYDDTILLTPFYIRQSEAETTWQQKQGAKGGN